MKRMIGFSIALAAMSLSACETEEGYRQQMATWAGRSGDDVVIQWGAPQSRTPLSDGREVWTYTRTTVTEQAEYYTDEQRQVKRTYTDKDGKTKTETITETYPVRHPAQTIRSTCQTRFVLSPDHRVLESTFDGPACVAPEQKS
ncbi:MAG TPA: hypothetical protein VG942_11690 [Hyphomonadaceae bacterium]|nr:hypothetical protein [Hyphomonadaceae bacterium]